MSDSTFAATARRTGSLRRAGITAWLQMPRLLAVVAAALAIVTAVFGVAIWAEQSTARELEGAQSEIEAARGVIATYASVMRTQAETLEASAGRSTGSHRGHWIDDARALTADADQLDAAAALLASQARLLGQHPGRSVRSDLGYVHGIGDALIAEGDRLVARAAVVRTHAADMALLAQDGDTEIAQADVSLLREGADRIADAGSRMRTIGAALRQVGEQFMRSLGR